MEVTFNNKELLSALRKLKPVVPQNPIMSVLENISIRIKGNEAIVIGSNLEVTVMQIIVCESSSDFTTLIPFAFLVKISELTGDSQIKIEKTDKNLTVYCGGDEFFINGCEDESLYPKIPEVVELGGVQLPEGFIEQLNNALSTITRGTTLRPEATKVCIDIHRDKIVVASMNSMAIFTKTFNSESSESGQILISEGCVKSIFQNGELRLSWNKNCAVFKGEGYSIYTTTHEGVFLPYESIMPDDEPTLIVGREELIYGIKKCSIVNDSYTSHFTLSLKEKENSLILISGNTQNSKTTKVEIDGYYTGTQEYISFNVENILKPLSQTAARYIHLSITNEKDGVIITSPEDPTYRGLVQPVIT